MSLHGLGNGSSVTTGDDGYDDWYINEPEEGPAIQEIVSPCSPTIPDHLYHTIMAPVSLAVLVVLSVLVKRRKLCKGCLNGVPGIPSPVNFLEEQENKGLIAAVFGILICSLCKVFLDDNPLPFLSNTSLQNREYWKILALFYYPALYYPLLACMTVRHRAGDILGSALSWFHCGILIWQKIECPQLPKYYKFYSLLSALPQISCFLALSFIYPALLLRNCRGASNYKASGRSYCEKYLKNILNKNQQKTRGYNPNQSFRPWLFLRSYIYTFQQGFQLPLMLVLSATVAIIVVYQVALLLLVFFLPTMQRIRAGIGDDFALMLAGFGIVLAKDKTEVVNVVKYYLWALEVCYVSALVISCSLTVAMLMRSLVMHRTNLKALYRGAVSDVFQFPQKLQPSHPAIVSWMSFTSYQAALTCLGLLLQQTVFFLCNVSFTFLVIIPLAFGRNLLLFRVLKAMWPIWLMLVSVVTLQHLCARFAFLHKECKQQEVTNRRMLYLFTYLLFPVNFLLGLLVGVWRMVISALYNIVHLCRLDLSLLHRAVESFDPAYRTYCHFLKIEVSQSHPLLKAACFLLLQLSRHEGQTGNKPIDVEEGIQLMQSKKPVLNKVKSKQARARWWVAYTLLKNPTLLASRASFLFQCTANGTQAVSSY
uniref:Receptor for retinol uptake STRA6 n=1 Tax=Geotrypetes seraphini TaxID=260995 RepID=A0A6P8NI58_GEOSA|nr:receptor for retinol uptake STRA6 [Geotrypetes seraphini]XP_033775613.1 receptor for retinol uptake STRA6 [Geotrypetes seraphini]XP_033775614.1 receptor for retinol uptake STRA6 [Geotrypetes seraphini]XP_033775615.1 receptor for retinol uptake STRA6 [Geotrypetes seraphini]